MSHRIKKALGKILIKLPIISSYLGEKEGMRQQLHNQNIQIGDLEHRISVAQKKLETRRDRSPRTRFITNQLDSTGAPLIFIDVVKDFIKSGSHIPFDVTTFEPVNTVLASELKDLGVNIKILEKTEMGLSIVAGDMIILNTAAYSEQTMDSIFDSLERGILKKLIWYMHEDWPHIFFTKEVQSRIRNLIEKKLISIYIPASKAKSNHEKLYAGEGNITLLPYRINLPEEYKFSRPVTDFKTLRFVMVGKTGEGLKGHLPILYAFSEFKRLFYEKNKNAYRDFELRFISIEQDYLSIQIRRHASYLKNHFKQYPPLPHEEALNVIKGSNVTVCYSLRECLPIFVFEGMSMGHPILRNDASGLQEQLEDGENGYFIDSNDFNQVVDTIEKILNKTKTTDEKLAKMSQRSYEISHQQKDNDYSKVIDDIQKSWLSQLR